MMTLTRHNTQRITLELSGRLDSETLSHGLDELFELSSQVKHGTLLYLIHDLQMPSLGALAVEMSRLPKLFGLIKRFDRCAVVCDAGWVRHMARVEGALIPGLDIQSYQSDQKDDAIAWLAEIEATEL